VEFFFQPQDTIDTPSPDQLTEVHLDPVTGENVLSHSQGGEGDLTPAQREALPVSALPGGWEKTSRNAPCPCGSGKKFKHCHGSLA